MQNSGKGNNSGEKGLHEIAHVESAHEFRDSSNEEPTGYDKSSGISIKIHRSHASNAVISEGA